MRSSWSLFLGPLFAFALQTNNSIDDSSGHVVYDTGGVMSNLTCSYPACENRAGEFGLDTSKLHNGTFSSYATIIVPFQGNAFYLFLAVSPGEGVAAYGKRLFIDNVYVGGMQEISATPGAQYNVCAYANTSIPDGQHTFEMDSLQEWIFDYAIYTDSTGQPDPDPSSSATNPSSNTLTSSGTVSSSTGAGVVASSGAKTTTAPATAPNSKKKPPVGAIAGGVVGAVALISISIVGFILARRTRRINTPAMEQSEPPATDPLVMTKEAVSMEAEVPFAATGQPWAQPSTTTIPSQQDDIGLAEQVQLMEAEVASAAAELSGAEPNITTTASHPDDIGLAEQVRLLKHELRELRQRVDGGSTTSSETASLGRSLSTMKREQTQALQQHGRGSHVTDALVHTDSGLRLTAGRAEELPPTYVAD
ncbi:hypothetical protein DFH06DRAFT_1305929 [Mycena polygramma]|nr:hypothetical protein DFH06DRAFT_1305929 [Mycena polygramma]